MNQLIRTGALLAATATAVPAAAQSICESSGFFPSSRIGPLCDEIILANNEGVIPILMDDCPPDGPTSISTNDDDDDCEPTSVTIPGGGAWAIVTLSDRMYNVVALPEHGASVGIAEKLVHMQNIGVGNAVMGAQIDAHRSYWMDLRDALSIEEPWINDILHAGQTVFLLYMK